MCGAVARAARSQERENQRLRTGEQCGHCEKGHLRSRGPSGPPRSGKSGKNGAPHIGNEVPTQAGRT
jgi:hypothetical protein